MIFDLIMEHIEKNILEKYIISREDFTPGELDNIMAHLAQCAYCKDHEEKLTAFYDSVNKELQTEPTERDEAFAEKLLARKRLALPEKKLALQERVDNALSTFVEIIEPYHRPLMQRFVRYIQIHPIKFAGATSLAGIALAAAFLLVKPAFKDNNPVFAKIKNYVLTVYSKDAEILWKKGVIGLPDQTTEDTPGSCNIERKLMLGDLDGNGINEILIAGVNLNGSFTMDSLYCYEHDGKLRWAISAGKIISFGDTTATQHSTPNILDLMVIKKTTNSLPQLFVVANEYRYSPTKLFEVDPKNGREIQAYYNRGGGGTLLQYDIDRDGKQEIIFAGINDTYNRAFLAVLDPTNINGHAPVTAQYQPKNITAAPEKYYLLFPLTLLAKNYSATPYNFPMRIWTTNEKKINYQIQERLQHFAIKELEIQVVYSIDSTMQVKSVSGGDGFIKANEYMLKNGLIKESLIPKYLNQLKDSVLYWDGEKFVNTPTMNKKYIEVAMKLP